MAVSLAGLILRGTLVLWLWLESRDTIVYVPFPRSSPTLAWSETPAGSGEWRQFPGSGLVNVSKNIERLAVEHGDGENQGGPDWGVDP
jgi:hypothetical protein